MSDDLVTWLRAQLDEDEQVGADDVGGMCDGGVHLDRDRWLREVEAKRRIIDWVVAQQVPNSTIGDDFLYPLVALAAAYSDRPGYRAEWRP